MMELKGDYTFDAPQSMVWAAVQDPEVLGSVMPGGQGFEATSENEYAGALTVKVGPVQGVFSATIKLNDIVAPKSYSIQVDGKGAPGFVKATGAMKLEGRGEQTYMEYEGSANIGGRIASVGQRLIDATAKSIVRQSLEGLNEYLKVQTAQQSISAPTNDVHMNEVSAVASETNTASPIAAASQYKAPSQTKVAINVMRDVFNDLVPPAYQPILIIAVLAIIAVIIWLLVS
jgi:carbon monoxide dehydrogenase subunit G